MPESMVYLKPCAECRTSTSKWFLRFHTEYYIVCDAKPVTQDHPSFLSLLQKEFKPQRVRINVILAALSLIVSLNSVVVM